MLPALLLRAGKILPLALTLVAGCDDAAAPTTGAVRVSVTTTGVDGAGYSVNVDAGPSQSVGPDGTVTFVGLEDGDHVVTLSGVPANCNVVGSATRQVGVTAGATVEVAFTVTCASSAPIAYVRDDQIYLINPDGTGQVRLTTSGRNWAPVWSPDGRRIAFVSDRAGGFQLHVMDADGSNVVRRPSTTAGVYYPAWSPDGRWIAYVAIQHGAAEIYVTSAAADETVPVRLTNHSGADIDPTWSPDGSTIAFASDRDGPLDVYAMRPDGTGVTRLTTGIRGVLSAHLPAWSPDGRRIAVIRERCNGDIWCPFVAWWDYGDFPDFSVEIMNADGSGAAVVASTPSNNSVTRMSFTSRPAWSPDGLTLAFSREYSGGAPFSIEYIGVDGSNRRGVITNGGHSPSWRW